MTPGRKDELFDRSLSTKDGKEGFMNVNSFDLEAAIEDTLALLPESTDEQRLLVRRDLELGQQYPGKYVLFRDHWKKDGNRIDLHREVIASGDAAQVQRVLSQHPDRDQIMLRYISSDDEGLEELYPELPSAEE